MAIYHCFERLRDDGVIDLFTVVRGLRERRPEMIGTKVGSLKFDAFKRNYNTIFPVCYYLVRSIVRQEREIRV